MRIYAFYTFFTFLSQMFEDNMNFKKKSDSEGCNFIEDQNIRYKIKSGSTL
jgi:hypothetical protein